MTLMMASTRSSKGECGGLAMNSSSLMKSMPASHRTFTKSAVCCGDRPMLGLMIVPMSGRAGGAPTSGRLVPVFEQRPSRARRSEHQLPRAGDAELRSAKVLREGRRQFEVHQLQAGELAQLVQIALNGGDKRGQVVTHVFQRPRDDDFSALVGRVSSARRAWISLGARSDAPWDGRFRRFRAA
jgi:hypothetical protein